MGKFEPTEQGTAVTDSMDSKKSRKRKHSKIDDLEKVDDADNTRKDNSVKRRKPEPTVGENNDGEADGDADGKDKKQRKKNKNVAQSEAHVKSDVQKKKKTNNTTGFADPNADETLDNQSRKSLAYAFKQFHCPSKWKFNKACQNWLLRNFWSEKEIPEVHMPLVTAYLAKVQGGARENLMKFCHEVLEPLKIDTELPSTDLPASDTPSTVESRQHPDTDSGKRIRAQAVLDALVSSNKAVE